MLPLSVQACTIAEPIPMKRELKQSVPGTIQRQPSRYCRAYPDEKGIETFHQCQQRDSEEGLDCRAYPDEKGIETRPGKIKPAALRGLQSLSR